MIRLLFLTLLLSLPAPLALAQTENGGEEPAKQSSTRMGSATTKDSVYFTMDDGIMSQEEMEEEATYVFDMCNLNAAQRDMFDCECLAGAFLKEREKLGPMTPQTDIVYRLTLGDPASTCANTQALAGDTFIACMDLMAPHRYYESKEDNAAYCECAANKVAKDFGSRPAMSPAYIRSLTYKAYLHCDNPANRPPRGEAPRTAN